jgi:hypothetical protein
MEASTIQPTYAEGVTRGAVYGAEVERAHQLANLMDREASIYKSSATIALGLIRTFASSVSACESQDSVSRALRELAQALELGEAERLEERDRHLSAARELEGRGA